MAKDPAFLFYPGDASNDTQFMNRLERGAYFDLVKAQRLFGGYTTVQLRKILGNDFETVWPALELVLERDGDLYFVGWLRSSISKRDDYSKKQSERVKKRWNNDGNTVVLPKKENEIGIENRIESGIEKRAPKFQRPELKEVENYMNERNMVAGGLWQPIQIQTESKKFWNFYESKGWMVGKNKMKDWQAAIRNWMNTTNEKINGTNSANRKGERNSFDLANEVGQILRADYQRKASGDSTTS